MKWLLARKPLVPRRAAPFVMALAGVGGIAVIAYFARTWNLFFYDEWSVVLYRRHGGLASLLAPHNGHLQATLIALYRVLFETAGLDHYWPYRAASLVGHATVVGLLFVYAWRRVAPEIAVAIGVLVLMLGWAWEVLFWPINLGFVIPVAALLLVLLLWDPSSGERASLRVSFTVAVVVGIALASSTLGVAVAVGLGVEALRRRQRGDLVAVGIPTALFAAWFFLYRPSASTPASLRLIPGADPRGDLGEFAKSPSLHSVPSYVLHLAQGAANGLVGLNPKSGIWVLLAIVMLIAICLMRETTDRWRLLAVGSALVVFWALVAGARGGVGLPLASRYIYPGAVMIAVLVVESLRGASPPRAVTLLVIAVLAFGIYEDVGQLRDMSANSRVAFDHQRIELRALLARHGVPPGYEPDPLALPGVRKGPLEAAVRDLGYPRGTRP
jgi:hypothetical protein